MNELPGPRSRLTPSDNDPQRVDIEAGIGLVEHREPRLEQRHLQNLVALLLAAGEADIDRAAQHVLIDAELLGDVAHPFDEFRRGQLPLAALLALRVERGAQERHGGDAGNFQRILEREEQPGGGALVWRHVENVLAVEAHLARGRLVAVLAGKHIGKRRFARAVRAHDGVHLAGIHGEVETFEDLLAVDCDVQVFDFQ